MQLFRPRIRCPNWRQNCSVGNYDKIVIKDLILYIQVIVKISTATMEEVEELKETIRGKRGFGSTGLSEEIDREKMSKEVKI